MRFYWKTFLPNMHLPRWIENWLSYPVDEKALNLWTDHSPWYHTQRLLKCFDDDLYQHVRTRIPRCQFAFQKRLSLIFDFYAFLTFIKEYKIQTFLSKLSIEILQRLLTNWNTVYWLTNSKKMVSVATHPKSSVILWKENSLFKSFRSCRHLSHLQVVFRKVQYLVRSSSWFMYWTYLMVWNPFRICSVMTQFTEF